MSRSAPARPRAVRLVAAAVAMIVVPLGVIALGIGSASATATNSVGGPNVDNLSADTGGGDTIPPTTPANPRTSNLTCNSVDFAWDASSDNVAVTNYDIFHDGQLIKTVGGGTTSTSLTVVPTVKI